MLQNLISFFGTIRDSCGVLPLPQHKPEQPHEKPKQSEIKAQNKVIHIDICPFKSMSYATAC